MRLDLSSRDARDRAWSTVGERLLRMSTSDRGAAITSLGAALDVSLPPRPSDDYAAMTWEQAAQMDRALIDFGSHTCTHPVLSRCGPAELVYEVRESRQLLARRLGRVIDTFAYPHGEPADVDGRAVEAVCESWLLEDRWWTDRPVRRRYWEIVTTCGRNVVVFRELLERRWYRQR
jgi:peptidoglycan/xylan/chitin deacetylase (PgdA/CDA1 family)